MSDANFTVFGLTNIFLCIGFSV